jgi:hypothetical protein
MLEFWHAFGDALLILACLFILTPVLFAFIRSTQSLGAVLSPSLVPGGSSSATSRRFGARPARGFSCATPC